MKNVLKDIIESEPHNGKSKNQFLIMMLSVELANVQG